MDSQFNILSGKLFNLLEVLLDYSLFHNRLDEETDHKIYNVIRRIEEVKKLAEKEVSKELFDDLISVIGTIIDLFKTDFYSLKYLSNFTDERIEKLIYQLKEDNLSTEEIDNVIDKLSIHLYKFKLLNQ